MPVLYDFLDRNSQFNGDTVRGILNYKSLGS